MARRPLHAHALTNGSIPFEIARYVNRPCGSDNRSVRKASGEHAERNQVFRSQPVGPRIFDLQAARLLEPAVPEVVNEIGHDGLNVGDQLHIGADPAIERVLGQDTLAKSVNREDTGFVDSR